MNLNALTVRVRDVFFIDHEQSCLFLLQPIARLVRLLVELVHLQMCAVIEMRREQLGQKMKQKTSAKCTQSRRELPS